MGTSELSEVILKELIENKYNLVGVFTKPDQKVGRKQELTTPLVKKLAEEKNIPVFQPLKFNSEAVEQLKSLKPDLVIVAAYGKILPSSALEIPGFGCINVHVSLLPKFRGPSPIQNALLQGEKETGITIMLMDEGVDTGDILTQEKIEIADEDNHQALSEKLSKEGAKLLIKTIPQWVEQKIQPLSQEHEKATFCELIEREDGKIYWINSAEEIYNRYRALTPWPGIYTHIETENGLQRLKLIKIKLQKTDPIERKKEGEVFQIGEDIGIQTSKGIVILQEVQKEGKKVTDIKSFLNGQPGFIGSVLV